MPNCDMNGMVLILRNALLSSLLTALLIYVQKPVANCNQMAKDNNITFVRFFNGLSLRCKEIFFMGWWDALGVDWMNLNNYSLGGRSVAGN